MLTVPTRTVNVLNRNGIELFEGVAAWQQLSNESFLTGWDRLYEACSWATIFQSRAFITTWYYTYRETHIPLFIVNFEANRLSGLFFLAKTKDGDIVGAGESQAEYQVWLATADNGNAFIIKALKIIDSHFPGKKLQIKYIPGNAPMQWINENALLRKRCLIKSFRQPLLKIDEGHFIKELQKKNRREKLNRLARIGTLKFEHITDYSLFDEVLDSLVLQFDFRKKAVYNTAIFQEDPKRKSFLLSLFKLGLLHVTILKVNDEIIASNVSVTGKHWVHLQGINTHAPSYAKHSPGILHLLMLGKQLANENIAVFDLTPGEDPYKGQLATDYSEAYHLIVSSPYQNFIGKIRLEAAEQLKKRMLRLNLTPAKFKWQFRKFKDKYKHILNQGVPFATKYFLFKAAAAKKEDHYIYQPDQSTSLNEEIRVNKNSLSDLLSFDPGGTSLNAWAFFEDAMHRFENGEIAFTYAEGGYLEYCVWLRGAMASKKGGDLALTGFYCHSKAMNRIKDFLRATMQLVIKEIRENDLYAQINKNDKSISQALKASGFKLCESVERRIDAS